MTQKRKLQTPQSAAATFAVGPPPLVFKPSALVPRRPANAVGRRPPLYPDLNYHNIGQVLNISPTYIGRILNGVSRPSMKVAQRLSSYMGWSLDQLASIYDTRKARESAASSKTKTKKRRK